MTPTAKQARDLLERACASVQNTDDECQAFDALLAFIDAAEAREWQPIATAPKDGTRVLLLVPSVLPVRVGQVDIYRTGWRTDGGQKILPTHWMPLPAPPGEAQP